MHAVLQSLYDFRLTSTGALLTVLYAVVIGGAFGSFLNVVAYRLPLGMNLSRPGSRCPKCQRPIRPWHNIPVLGWLLLRGRCRDCGAPISPRYPIVELLVAVASGIVVFKSMTPEFKGETTDYAINLIAVVLRLMLLYLLFTSALLEFDGSRLPLRLNLAAAMLLALGALFISELRPPQPFDVRPPLSALAIPLEAAAVLGLLSWPILLLPPSGTLAGGAARMGLLVLFALVMGGLATMFAAPATVVLLLAAVIARAFWPAATRLGWASMLLGVTLLWFVLTGPEVSSNDVISFDYFFVVPDMQSVLVPVGVSTAVLVLICRLVHWLLTGNPRPAP